MERENLLFKLENVSKEYKMGEVTIEALKSVHLHIPRGELIIVLGPSGSGKSTLLNILGGMDVPTSGQIHYNDREISGYGERDLTNFRRDMIGFVFQFYNLMPSLTARENVELATEVSEHPLDIDEVLEKVGLKERSDHFPAQLSGGEQQRVAIARAVAKNPEVLMCDEPTGALDYNTGIKVLTLLRQFNRDLGKTVLIITHNQPVAQMGDRVIKLRSGQIVEVAENPHPLEPHLIEW